MKYSDYKDHRLQVKIKILMISVSNRCLSKEATIIYGSKIFYWNITISFTISSIKYCYDRQIKQNGWPLFCIFYKTNHAYNRWSELSSFEASWRLKQRKYFIKRTITFAFLTKRWIWNKISNWKNVSGWWDFWNSLDMNFLLLFKLLYRQTISY